VINSNSSSSSNPHLLNNPDFNTAYPIKIPENIFKWINQKCTNAEQRLLLQLPNFNPSFLIEKKDLIEQRIKNRFDKACQELMDTALEIHNTCQDTTKRLREITTPIETMMPAMHYIFRSFDYLFVEILMNSSNPDPIAEKWTNCKLNLALLRDARDPDIITKINTFFDDVTQEIEKCGPEIEKGNFLKEFRTVLDKLINAPDLLDFALGTLLNDKWVDPNSYYNSQEQPSIQTSIPSIVDAFQEEIVHIVKNIDWIAPLMSKKLMQLENAIDPKVNASTEIPDLLDEYFKKLKIYLEQLKKLKDPKEIIDNTNLLSEFFLHVHSLHRLEMIIPGLPIRSLGDLEERLNINNFQIKQVEKYYSTHSLDEKDVVDPSKYFVSDIANQVKLIDSMATWSLKDYREYYICLETVRHVSVWVNTFITQASEHLCFLAMALRTWKAGQQKHFNKLMRQYPMALKQWHSLQRAHMRTPINEDTVPIQSLSSGKNKSARKGKAKRQKGVGISQKTATTIVSSASSSSASSIEALSSVKAITHFHPEKNYALQEILHSQELPNFQRTAVRQALMYTNDVFAMQQRLELSFESHLFLFTLSSSYFSMEQVLRYQNQIKAANPETSFSFHNLIRHLWELTLDKNYNLKIAQTLFHANAWLSDTYKQIEVGKEVERHRKRALPSPLEELHRIFESPQTGDPRRLRLLCQSYLSDTVAFIQQFHDTSKLVRPDVSKRPVANQLNLRSFDKGLLKTGSHKQIHATLIALQSIYKEWNSHAGTVTMMSLFMRMAIYWEGHLLQQLLKKILAGQSSEDWAKEHDLVKIAQAIQWPDKIDVPILLSLCNEMNQWHNVSRYPFEFSKVISPLHKFVLIAEMIRNGSSTPEGFKPQENDSITHTNLDFIGIPTVDATTDIVTSGLEAFYRNCRKVSDLLLPLLDS